MQLRLQPLPGAPRDDAVPAAELSQTEPRVKGRRRAPRRGVKPGWFLVYILAQLAVYVGQLITLVSGKPNGC